MPKVNVPAEFLGVIYPDNPSPRRSASTSHPYSIPEPSRRARGQARSQSSHIHPPAATYPLHDAPYHQPRPNPSSSLSRPPITSPPPHVLPEPYQNPRAQKPSLPRDQIIDQRPPRDLPQYPPPARSDPLRDLADLALSRGQPPIRPRRARIASPVIHEIQPLRIIPNPYPHSLPQIAPGVEHQTTRGSFYAPHVFDGTSLPRVRTDRLERVERDQGFEDVRKFGNLPTMEEMAKHVPVPRPAPRPLSSVAPSPLASAQRASSSPQKGPKPEKGERTAPSVVASSRKALGGNQGTAVPVKRKHMFGELPEDGQPARAGPFANLLKSRPGSPRHPSEAPDWQERSRKMMHIKSVYSPPSPVARTLPLLDVKSNSTPSTSLIPSSRSSTATPARSGSGNQLDRRDSTSALVRPVQLGPPPAYLDRRSSAPAVGLTASRTSYSTPKSAAPIVTQSTHLGHFDSSGSQELAATQQSEPSSQPASLPMSANTSSTTVETVSTQESVLLASPTLPARVGSGRSVSVRSPQDPSSGNTRSGLEITPPKRYFWNDSSDRGKSERSGSGRESGAEDQETKEQE